MTMLINNKNKNKKNLLLDLVVDETGTHYPGVFLVYKTNIILIR